MLDAEAVCGTRVCPPHSSCIDLHCVCDPLYVGPSCEVSYEAELGRGALVAFDLGVVASNLGVVAVATYVMQRRCRRIELRWRVNEPIQALLFAGLAAVVRIVQYGVRPATLGTWCVRPAPARHAWRCPRARPSRHGSLGAGSPARHRKSRTACPRWPWRRRTSW